MVKICFFKKHYLIDFRKHRKVVHGSTKLFMADLLKSNGILDVKFVKKITLEMVIGQQMKEEGLDRNH